MTDGSTTFEGDTLRVVATRAGEHLDVRLHGELDMAHCDLLRSVFVMDLTAVSHITVHLGDLEFVDSTGVQAFLQVRAAQMQAGRRVRFERPRPPVRRVFRILGIEGLLTAQPPAADAHGTNCS